MKEIQQKILYQLDIIQFISRYVHLKKQGKSFVGRCPFHIEKTPSFHVNAEKKFYYCFGCKEGGDVFSFLMKYKSYSFYQALTEVANELSIPIVRKQFGKDENSFFLYVLKCCHRFFQKSLLQNIQVLNYLEKRGLQRSIIDLFELGFAIKNHKLLIRFLESKKISLEEQIKSRIIQKGKDNSFYGYFSGRIIFPIFDENSQLIAFGGRVLTSNYSPKYLNSPENFLFIKKKILYGLNFAKQVLSERKKLYIVEGYLDVIILHQNGFENSVAPLGTSFTQEHFLKASFYTKKIVLLFDGDEAGEKASYRVFEQYLNLDIETELELYIVALPENYDPLSYINEFGIDNFKNILKKEEKFSFFYIKKQIRLLESESSNLIKKKVLHDIYGTIQKIKSEVEKEDILYYLSTLLRIRRQAVLKDFQYFDDNNKKMQNRWIKKEENKAVEAIEPEKYLVLFLIHHIDYFLKYQERILNLLLEDSFANKVLNIILEFNRIEDIKKNEDIHYDYFFHFLISKLDSVDKNFVQKEIFNEKYYIDSDNQIEEIFDQIYLKRIKNQIEKINIRFDELKSEKDIDADKLKNLMEEKHYWINEYFKYKKR